MVASRATTSAMMCSGTDSRRLPFRAPRSRARGWSQRITPVVRVPAGSRATAKPRLCANPRPVVMGRTTGVPVTLLKAAGETISTGRVPFCSWPAVGSRLTSHISPRSTTATHGRRAWHRPRRDPRRKRRRSRRTGPAVHRGSSGVVSWAQRPNARFPRRYQTLAPAPISRRSRRAGGTASMTEPPTLRRFVVCMDTSIIILQYNCIRRAAQGHPRAYNGQRCLVG